MTRSRQAQCGLVGRMGMAMIALTGAASGSTAADRPPAFSQVEKAVTSYFAGLRGGQPGVIITRSEVEALFGDRTTWGWLGGARQEIIGRVLADDEFLAQELRTDEGRKFAAQPFTAW